MEFTNNIQPLRHEGMSIYRPPLCHELVGRSFKLVLDDGYDRTVEFLDRENLRFGKVGEASDTISYDCLKIEKTTYFVNFEKPGLSPRVGVTLVLDLEQSLVTMARAYLGRNPKYPRMPEIEFIFGAIERPDGTVPTVRHGFTQDMVGRALNWNYGRFEIVHVYSSERYYRVAFSEKRLARLRAKMAESGEAPRPSAAARGVYEDHAAYIKIKDGIYLVSLLESILCVQNGHGNSLLFLMDLNEGHDVGRSFGTNPDWQDENYTFGAFGEDFDASETLAKPSTYHIR